jgi:7-cyano-7-deazaguanine synthase in queuosine biosynthesis
VSQVVVAEPSIHRTVESTVVQVDVTAPGRPPLTVEYILPPVAVRRQQIVDAMFVIGRLVAMKGGWQLVLPGAVSWRLLDRAEIMQDVFLDWYPSITKPIPLDFEVAEPLDLPSARGAITTFSGGVDSFHTVLEHREELNGLVFIHGLDIRLEDTDFRARVSKELTAAAADLGLPLLEVETNVRALTNPYASWGKKAHGAILSSVAILLAETAETFYIPGSRLRGTVRGQGWGSHVLIDRLNSTDYLSVVHDGVDTTRVSKTACVAQTETALRYLRVCYSSREAYNCGTCPKCRRTQLDLHLGGVTDTGRIFADSVPIAQLLEEFEVPSPGALNFAVQTVQVARSQGRMDIVLALKQAINQYQADVLTTQAVKLRSTLRTHPEFLKAFPPRAAQEGEAEAETEEPRSTATLPDPAGGHRPPAARLRGQTLSRVVGRIRAARASVLG